MGLLDKDNSGIVDIAIPQTEKTRFRINGANDKVIWLNTNVFQTFMINDT